jgi:hypothetical protein
LASFLLGWGVTTGAGLASYPLDTIRRRMMMTSGGTGPHYKSMFDAGSQIIAKEGVKSLFKGAGAVSTRGTTSHLEPKLMSLFVAILYRTSSEVLPVPVSCPCTTSSRSSCSARSTPVVPVKRSNVVFSSLAIVSPYHDRFRFHSKQSFTSGVSLHAVVFKFRWLPFRAVSWLRLACFDVFGRLYGNVDVFRSRRTRMSRSKVAIATLASVKSSNSSKARLIDNLCIHDL